MKTKPTMSMSKNLAGKNNPTGGVSVLGDHVYFYTDINPDSAMELNRILQDLSMRLAPTVFSSMHEVGSPSPIWLHINSYGGEVFSSFAIADTIERISKVIPIITIIEGCAASGATLIALAGTKRLIRKNAFMLIHELSDGHWGKYSDQIDHLESNTEIMKSIKKHYKELTKIPEKELEELLKHDIWWNSKKCKKLGLVDEIL